MAPKSSGATAAEWFSGERLVGWELLYSGNDARRDELREAMSVGAARMIIAAQSAPVILDAIARAQKLSGAEVGAWSLRKFLEELRSRMQASRDWAAEEGREIAAEDESMFTECAALSDTLDTSKNLLIPTFFAYFSMPKFSAHGVF